MHEHNFSTINGVNSVLFYYVTFEPIIVDCNVIKIIIFFLIH